MLKWDQQLHSLFAVKTVTRCSNCRRFRDPHNPYITILKILDLHFHHYSTSTNCKQKHIYTSNDIETYIKIYLHALWLKVMRSNSNANNSFPYMFSHNVFFALSLNQILVKKMESTILVHGVPCSEFSFSY